MNNQIIQGEFIGKGETRPLQTQARFAELEARMNSPEGQARFAELEARMRGW